MIKVQPLQEASRLQIVPQVITHPFLIYSLNASKNYVLKAMISAKYVDGCTCTILIECAVAGAF